MTKIMAEFDLEEVIHDKGLWLLLDKILLPNKRISEAALKGRELDFIEWAECNLNLVQKETK